MKRYGALAALLGADLATKALAFRLLPVESVVDERATVQLVLRTNATGVGSWAQAAYPDMTAVDRVAASFGVMAICAVLVAARRARRSKTATVLLCIFSYFATVLVCDLVLRAAGPLPSPLSTGLSRIGGVVLVLYLRSLTRSGVWRVATTLLAAAALGNFAGVLLPPHAVVDFVFSEPIFSLLGIGVFNLADVYYLVALPLLGFALLRAIVRRLRRQPDLQLGLRVDGGQLPGSPPDPEG
jgi:hypothetical protein